MKKKDYQAPQLTVVLFRSERGYASSPFALGLVEHQGSKNIEQREESGFWGSESEWNE